MSLEEWDLWYVWDISEKLKVSTKFVSENLKGACSRRVNE